MKSSRHLPNSKTTKILFGISIIVIFGVGYFYLISRIKKSLTTFNRSRQNAQLFTPINGDQNQSSEAGQKITTDGQPNETHYPFSIAKPLSRSVKLTIDFAVGPLRIGSGSSQLAQGELISDQATVEINSRDDQASLIVKPIKGKIGRTNQLGVRLNQGLEYDLTLKGGAGQLDIDFRDIDLKTFTIEAGAVSGTLILPKPNNRVLATIKLGASSLTIKLPKEIALSAKISDGAIQVNTQGISLTRSTDNQYQSPHFSSPPPEDFFDIVFDSGAATLTFIEY